MADPTKSSDVKYMVLSRIWHTADLKHYEAGAVVTLDHLSADSIKILTDQNVVRAATAEEIAKAKAK